MQTAGFKRACVCVCVRVTYEYVFVSVCVCGGGITTCVCLCVYVREGLLECVCVCMVTDMNGEAVSTAHLLLQDARQGVSSVQTFPPSLAILYTPQRAHMRMGAHTHTHDAEEGRVNMDLIGCVMVT